MQHIKYLRQYGSQATDGQHHFHARWVWLALFLMGAMWMASELSMPLSEAQASRMVQPQWRRTDKGWEDRSSWGIDTWKPALHPLAVVSLEIAGALALLVLSRSSSRASN